MELVGTKLVDKYYEANTETEELRQSKDLKDGMIVLVGDERYREDLPLILINHSLRHAMISNRWATISNLKTVTEKCSEEGCCEAQFITFTATYEDDLTIERKYLTSVPWFVKTDTPSEKETQMARDYAENTGDQSREATQAEMERVRREQERQAEERRQAEEQRRNNSQ